MGKGLTGTQQKSLEAKACSLYVLLEYNQEFFLYKCLLWGLGRWFTKWTWHNYLIHKEETDQRFKELYQQDSESKWLNCPII